MYKYLKISVFIVSILFALGSRALAQEIMVKPLNTGKEAHAGAFRAQVDIISESPNLIIEENGGETVQPPQQRSDGKYVYTCVCDVNDTNKFGFNIAVQGGATKRTLLVYIEENQLLEYEVDVEEIPVSFGGINVVNDRIVVPIENTAKVFITSNYNNLQVQSDTGEKTEGPVLNETNTFEYTIIYDLSTSESREMERSLTFTAGKASQQFNLGALQPKSGREIAVIVLSEACYIHNKNYIQECFLNGLYREAYETYRKLLEEDLCPDKPADTASDEKEMALMKRLAAAHIMSNQHFIKAEKFEEQNRLDSAMYYHGEAHKYRNLILKSNSADPYCLEYNKRYDFFKAGVPRIVSGRTVDNARMNAQGENIPINGAYVILTEHKRDSKKVNGIQVPAAGRETDVPQLIGQSDANGNFSVSVPRNTKDTVYQLNFTADEESMGKKSYGYKYLPKDADVETNVIVKLTPKSLN